MTQAQYVQIEKCRICKSTDLFDVIDLGKQPIPNGFLQKDEILKKEKKYPLAVCLCKNCSLMQLKFIVRSSIMFKNYLYIPSSSKTRISHFQEMAIQIKNITKFNEKSLVIDVGSNDGSFLKCFKNLGTNVLGIDPAENLAKIAELNGIETVVDYFDSKSAEKIKNKYGKADAITATNVIAHIPNLDEVLKGGNILLKEGGIFVMEFPYLLDLIQKNLFDTIYHEHLSYFSVKSLLFLSKNSELEIFEIERNDLDGGALRVFWKKKSNNKIKINQKRIDDLLLNEKRYSLYEINIYKAFENRVKKLKIETVKKLNVLKKKNKRIAGYGAAAKTNVLLNYFGIDFKTIEYIVDSTSYKQGLYTPGSHIPIFPEDKIYETIPDYTIIFAWNFSDEIIQKNKKYQNLGGKFIVLEPEFKIL